MLHEGQWQSDIWWVELHEENEGFQIIHETFNCTNMRNITEQENVITGLNNNKT